MTKLTWADLIIEDISPEQFRDWMAPWNGLVVGRIAPAFMTKFGLWFLRRPEGNVEMLDVLNGTVSRVNDTFDDFVRDINERGWQEANLFSDLVLQLHNVGKIPGPNQCFALAPHPALGGPNPMNGDIINPQLVMVMDIPVWQSICAQSIGLTT
jgi:hypothetical protein